MIEFIHYSSSPLNSFSPTVNKLVVFKLYDLYLF